MASPSVQTVTVDRLSNSGNAIAQQQQAGKTIHVPAGEVGATYDVRLVDKGGYFVARLVDRASETQPRQPGIGPDTSRVGKDLLESERNQGHSFSIRSSIAGGSDRTGQAQRKRLARRKK